MAEQDPFAGAIRQPERFERLAARSQGGLEEIGTGVVEQVERDEHDRDLGQQLLRRPHPTEPGLEGSEVEDRSLAPRDELAVDDEGGGVAQRLGRADDLGKRAGDVVQVAAEELDRAVTVDMELAADAVVLVLDPRLVAHPSHDLGRVRHRRREHEANRPTEVERGLGEPAVPCQHRGLPDLAGEHVGAAHRVQLRVEGGGHGLLEQALSQTDARLPRRHAAQEASLVRARAGEQAGERRDTSVGRAGCGDRLESMAHVRDRQAQAVRLATGEQLGRGVTEVAMAQVGLAHRVGIGTAGRRERGALLHPAHPELGGRVHERTAGEEGRGVGKVTGWQAPEAGRQQVALRELAAG